MPVVHPDMASPETVRAGKVNFNPDVQCWICEGWLEKRFKVSLNEEETEKMGDDTINEHYNVFMHFDFDEWEPDIMEERRKTDISKKGKFLAWRMIP